MQAAEKNWPATNCSNLMVQQARAVRGNLDMTAFRLRCRHVGNPSAGRANWG